jgi:hypothetical protein
MYPRARLDVLREGWPTASSQFQSIGCNEPLAGAAKLAATDSGFAAQVNRGLQDHLDNRTHPGRQRRMGAG